MKKRTYLLAEDFSSLHFQYEELPDKVKEQVKQIEITQVDGVKCISSETFFIILYSVRVQSKQKI